MHVFKHTPKNKKLTMKKVSTNLKENGIVTHEKLRLCPWFCKMYSFICVPFSSLRHLVHQRKLLEAMAFPSHIGIVGSVKSQEAVEVWLLWPANLILGFHHQCAHVCVCECVSVNVHVLVHVFVHGWAIYCPKWSYSQL